MQSILTHRISNLIVFLFFSGSPGSEDGNSAALKKGWPAEVVGRSLQTVTQDYVLYATTDETGRELTVTIESEIRAFKTAYPAQCGLPIVIVAIENVFPENSHIETIWRRPRYESRLYTLTLLDVPYYRETYCVRDRAEARMFFPELADQSFFTVCLVNTDREFQKSFDEEVDKNWAGHKKSVENTPEEVRRLSCLALPLLRLAATIAFEKMRHLDLRLMILRRREVLWLSWLKCIYIDDDARKSVSKQLSDEIADQWKQILSKKPRC